MSVRKTGITVASAAALAIAIPAVQKYEGYAPTVVPDRLAGGLPTGRLGVTESVKLGETHDKAYWSARLAKRLADDYDAGIGKCIKVDLPDGVRAMAISTAYNAGIAAVCKSPMVAKWNAGDIEGGCKAIRGWRICSRPDGPGTPCIVVQGLVNRRNDEAAKCLGYARGQLKPPVVTPPPKIEIAEAPPPAPPAPSKAAPIEAKPPAQSGWVAFWSWLRGKA